MKRICGIIVLHILTFQLHSQTPDIFMPDITKSFPNVRDMAISNQGNEIFFTVQSYKKEFSAIVVIKKTNNKWSEPNLLPFTGHYTDIEPALTADGLKLYFSSNRPKTNKAKAIGDFDIWYVERKSLNANWSAPVNMGAPINTISDEFYPSITASGNLYFTANYNTGKGNEDIFIAKFIDGKYQKPIVLPDAINTKGWEFNAFVAPDELFIIFTSTDHANNLGGGDLYICYKNNEDRWSKAENLGLPINSPKLDFCPYVDINSETFYFSSDKTTINKSFAKQKTIQELKQVFNATPNGLTRIYSIPFKTITK